MPQSSSTASTVTATLAVLAGGLAAFHTVKKLRKKPSLTLTLPAWATSTNYYDREYNTEAERMGLAIELASRNVAEKTGGPFGTAIFERDVKSGKTKLFSIGMNQVVSLNNSTLHGEMVAIQFAQKKLGKYTMGEIEGKEYDLYTSCEPCCMCLGGTLWSGVSSLICSASKQNAQDIGFDEGPVNDDSYKHLERAGIRVVKGVLPIEGAEVLRKYGETGVIY
jgi:tRNA(Arg) A34 adenosine deaminase TadA